MNYNNLFFSLSLIFLFPFTLRVVNNRCSLKEKSFVKVNQCIKNHSKSNKKNSLRASSKLPISHNRIQINIVDTEVIDFNYKNNNNYHTGFIKPVRGCVNSRFGNRNSGNHCGIDLHLRTGDTVYASNFGKVRFSKYHKGGYGNLIVLSHSNGIETYYAHLSKFLVSNETEVKVGQAIGLGGSTGRSSGPHLHFEIRMDGKTINPERFIFFGGKNLVKRDIEKIKAARQITPIIDLIETETLINKRKVILLGSSISKSTGFLANLKFEGDSTIITDNPRIVSVTINENFIKGTFIPSSFVSNQRLASLVSVAVAYKRPHSSKVEVLKGLLKVVN